MAALSKLQLKQLWKAYFQPTSADFSNLIDSWTDYSPALEAVGAAVSGGSTGVVNVTSPSTIAFLTSGATGQAVLATGTAASARTVLGLTAGATGQEILAAGTQASAKSAIGLAGLSLPVSVGNGGTGVASLSANHVLLGNGTSSLLTVAPGTSGNVLTSNGTTWQSSAVPAGKLVQHLRAETNSVGTTLTAIPWDDTPPLLAEGREFLSVSITPTKATNYLQIDVTFNVSSDAGNVTVALFQASGASAIAAIGRNVANQGGLIPLTLSHRILAASTSATQFQVRAGVATGTLTVNGESGARLFGGVLYSSITVTEIEP